MRLVVTSALILSIACSTLGYLVTQPRADDRWRCGEKRTYVSVLLLYGTAVKISLSD